MLLGLLMTLAPKSYGQEGGLDCASAEAITAGAYTYGTISGTGTDNSCAGYGGTGARWYSFTAPGDGSITVKSCGGIDTHLTVYAGCAGACLGTSDDDQDPGCHPNGWASTVTTLVSNGQTVVFQWTDTYTTTGSAFTLSFSGGGPPANDECATATPIGDGTHPFDNTLASGVDASSCTTGDTKDLWFSYTASCTGTATASTCGLTSLDTGLSAFDVCGGTELACNDDNCGLQSSIAFAVTSGSTYLIRVAGYNGSSGTGSILVGCSGPPANDECANAETIPVGAFGSCPGNAVSGDNTAAAQVFDDFACFTGGPFVDVWYTFNSGANTSLTYSFPTFSFGSILVDVLEGSCAGASVHCAIGTGALANPNFTVTPGTDYWVRVASEVALGGGAFTFCVSAAPGAPANDECSGAIAIFDGVTPVTNVGSTGTDITSCAFEDGTDVWFSYTASCTGNVSVSTCNDATFDTALSIWDVCGGTELACNDDGAGCANFSSNLTFTGAVSGTTYLIRLAGYNGAVGTANLTVSCFVPPPPPPNDLCTGAVNQDLAAGGTITFTGTSAGMTDTEGFGLPVGWEMFTLTDCVQSLEVSWCGSTPPRTLMFTNLFTGCPYTSFFNATQALNDCANGSRRHIYSGPIQAGTYYIAVGDLIVPGETGPYQIDVIAGAVCPPPPANDDCTGAPAPQEIGAGESITMSGSTTGATVGPDEFGFALAWEAFTLTECVSTLTIDFCGSIPPRTNALTAIFDGCPIATANLITQLTFETTSCGDGGSTQTFGPIQPGTYYIPILEDAGIGASGPYELHVTTSSELEATASVTDDCIGGTFTVVVDVTNIGGGGTIDYVATPGGPGSVVAAAGLNPLPAFPVGTEVSVTIDGGACDLDLGNYYSSCPVQLTCGAPPVPVVRCYRNNEVSSLTYSTDPGETITLLFSSGAIGPNDVITFYDGTDDTGAILPSGNGFSGVSLNGLVVTTTTNSLYITIESDGSGSCQDGQVPGATFNFNVQCTPDCEPAEAGVIEASNCATYSYTLDVEINSLGAGLPFVPPLTPETAVYVSYSVNGGAYSTPTGPYVVFDVVTLPAVGSFPIGTVVNVKLVHGSDALCDRIYGPYDGDLSCPPPGETCALPIVIPSVPTIVTGSTTAFVDNHNQVCPYTATGGRDVVYSYTPPVDQSISLTMCSFVEGSTTNFDSKLYVFAGSCGGASVACNDDLCNNAPIYTSNFISSITSLEGYDGASFGNYSLKISVALPPPANDNCANGIVVNTYPYTSPVISTVLATDDQQGVAGYACSTGPTNNVWWRVTGVCGTMTASTCGSSFDTEVAIYTGSCGALTFVGCNDDNGPACAGATGSRSWTATQGTTYYIAAGGWQAGNTGNIQLTVTASDTDGDGIGNTCDNCAAVSNTNQANADGDALGDACDACPNDAANDSDGDTVCGNVDNCPVDANTNQANNDGDSQGDVCDADDDNDGVLDGVDNCPLTANAGQENYDGDAFGDVCDADMDGDGIPNGSDSCPLFPGQNGGTCDSDPGPGYTLGTITACACVSAPCTQSLTIDWQTDANPGQITWEIRNQVGGAIVQSGGPLTIPSSTYPTSTCVPNGCYYLRVIDSGGDGMTAGSNGGYILKTAPGGVRLLDNFRNFGNLAGGPPDVSKIPTNEGFCIPLGTTTGAIYTSCDKLDWTAGEYLVCSSVPAIAALYGGANAATSGYEFWFFNPNGGYSFRKFRAHNQSDGFSPANGNRACHIKLNNWAAGSFIPTGVLMNVRVRTRNAGVNGNWGPACRMKIDPTRAQCPLTKLMDVPGNEFLSCGATRTWGAGNYVHAVPVTGANKYQFRFRIVGEPLFVVTRTTTAYFLQLNWTPALTPTQYYVDVRVSKDNGATWCTDFVPPALTTQWGDLCNLTISAPPVNGGNQNSTTQNAGLSMYPNPNRGDQLYLSLDAVEEGVNTVSVDIFDLFGKRVSARTIAVNDGFINTVLDLDGNMASGMYMVNITAGDKTYTERLVIQK